MFAFHYFRTFSSFIVCIFKGVKNYSPGGWGPLNARGPLCTAQPIATPLKAKHHFAVWPTEQDENGEGPPLSGPAFSMPLLSAISDQRLRKNYYQSGSN